MASTEIAPLPTTAGPLLPTTPNLVTRVYGFSLWANGGDVIVILRDGGPSGAAGSPIHLLDGESIRDTIGGPDGLRFGGGVWVDVDHPEFLFGSLHIRSDT